MSEAAQKRVGELLARLMESPRGYLHSLDLAKGAGLIVEAGPGFFKDALFLDGRVLAPGMTGAWVPLERIWREVEKGKGKPGPVHFIFHPGHAGSTLISRLLDEVPGVLNLREPEPLRPLAALHNRGGGDGFARLFSNVYALLARRFEAGQPVIVKATSMCSTLAPGLVAAHPENRALVVTVSLETYLANLLDKPQQTDVPAFAAHRLAGLQRRIPGFAADTSALSPGELIAFSWLAEIEALYQLADKDFRKRTLFVDFDLFLNEREPTIGEILAHFGLPDDKETAARLARSGIFKSYAKQPDFEYDAGSRAAILAESMAQNAAQIAAGKAFVNDLAGRHPRLARAVEFFSKS